MPGKKKPCKVWDGDKGKRKGIVASSFEEFQKKGCAALGLPANDLKRIVLERDGTQVSDAEYFDTLPDQTVFLFLREGQEWIPCDGNADTVDAASITEEGVIGSHRAWSLFLRVLEDPRTLTLMSESDLLDLVDLGENVNADGSFPHFIDRKLHADGRRVRANMIFDAAVRLLDERRKLTDAMDYMNLYRKAEAVVGSAEKADEGLQEHSV